MTIEDIDVDSTINTVKEFLKTERGLSPALRSAVELLVVLVKSLLDRLTLNSRNSSKPPRADPHRKKSTRKGKSGRKPGGQTGHPGSTLEPVADPDEVVVLAMDRRDLPRGVRVHEIEPQVRQVIDVQIRRFVTEYRAQVLEDEQGNQYVAPFPEGVNRPVQYGVAIKAHAGYLSQYRLIPYDRVRDHFEDQVQIPLSAGSIHNFNQEAYERLEAFERWAKGQGCHASVLHVDETGINIDGKGHWLHTTSSPLLTLFYPHAKRGVEALEEIGILPAFHGVLCQDHWKPYYRYDCLHALCNAHHLRELERAWEQDHQIWAQQMQELLREMAKAVDEAGGWLPPDAAELWRQRYRKVLEQAEEECPAPQIPQGPRKRGKLKRSKARNLLEPLRDFEDDTLRFLEMQSVPFTNNPAENDLRMTKVQQKISGCFRSMAGAKIFCRIRSYLSTCRKHGIAATEALTLLFQNKNPPFMDEPQCDSE